jgi:hypothetical protein
MLNIVSSPSADTSPTFTQSKRKSREKNLAWLQRHIEPLAEDPAAKGAAYLVMLGGRTRADFLLRVAQGHLRHDMSPSHWSHVVLLAGSGWTEKHTLWEISLEPAGGYGYPPSDNGVQNGTLDAYDSPYQFPNVAVLRLPVQLRDLKRALKTYKLQRATLDTVELILLWLGYVWGVGRPVNPLLDGHGIPSAAMIEILTGAAGFDLTPGLESRASCPEAIWQAARWWHEYYEAGDDTPDRRIHGAWHTEHFLGK